MEIRQSIWIWLFLSLFIFLISSHAMAAGKDATTLIGKETWNFNLASTQDKLINYGDEYYGKSFLIMTFFPAAFTPV
ncbi:MAG TPA: hypothetical protein VMT12_01240 [Syntrophales bacterium]|nr:hypothetical protein [Syntrophales bacterium]